MLSLIVPILYTVFYAVCGIVISCSVFSYMRSFRKCWFGLVFGLFGMTWMPSLFSFLSGCFSLREHIFGTVVFLLITAIFFCRSQKAKLFRFKVNIKSVFPFLCLLPVLIIGCKLFDTHILQEKADGLYVGQTTYGDLAMHLGFISSIATQGFFPPQYSIFPGHTINYPFLCEISASSLNILGASLRASYLISAIYAYILVLLGVFELFSTWLHKPHRAVLATYLFFIGGGFGFAYFLNNTNSTSFVASVLNTSYATNLSQLMQGYYTTPTNLPDLGLRWVNPIVDMLVPQRATLFGWAFLFPCLTLLFEYTFHNRKSTLIPLGILAGGLPLIHTHSFLALGVISSVYCLSDLIPHFQKKRLQGWLTYGGLAVLLASPQLFGFTFQQVSESSMVRFHFNWANDRDSWFWFYLKNWGILFLTLLPGMTFLSKRDRKIMSGPLILWALSELLIFQPNTYDNNKLIFVFFAFLCGLSAKLICVISHKLKCTLRESEVCDVTYPRLLMAAILFLVAFTVIPVFDAHSSVFLCYAKQGHLLTVLFISLIILILSLQYTFSISRHCHPAFPAVISVSASVLFGLILYLLLDQADSLSVLIPRKLIFLIMFLDLVLALSAMLLCLKTRNIDCPKSRSLPYAFFRLSGSVLICLLFLSGSMTIAREWVSSYQVFNQSDIAAAEYIKDNTPNDSVFLTSYSWHLNTVSVLTGRNIVCGPDLFLYYHGIDTSSRKQDIEIMFGDPQNASDLFSLYNVSYIYIGPDERYAFSPDTSYFSEHFEKVYDSGSITIFRIADNV